MRLQVSKLQSPLAGPYSFALEAGRCLTISGPSGAGKSLLLRMLCDLDPNTGEILLDGAPRSGMSAPEWRAQVVYQPAEPAWWLPTAGAHFKPHQIQRVHELLPQLKLTPTLLEHEVSRLSTGERQRMALIRSLACNPKVLLLDEPTAALDPESVSATEALLRREIDADMSLILVTHSTAQAQTLGQRHMTMRDRALHEGTP
ncbi:ATP-binding cassette domain-containing protein [Duganella sp. FT135W]|uniref:ATP-binding cassette domain-containing protein n=1 Tax=Duganella flavida TaxID=2692175 RepID=A0A6L8KCL9_9BURK|nr:ATP-binding cassette domain-containing protein [Duganella flavida]MYM24008.1 ATP-binding cassette domain-containing protein [Duganella flavida]